MSIPSPLSLSENCVYTNLCTPLGAGFHKALLTKARDAYRQGDEATGKAVPGEVINATIGLEQLAVEVGKLGKSLHRMMGPSGNPNRANCFAILQVLQKRVGVKLTLKAA